MCGPVARGHTRCAVTLPPAPPRTELGSGACSERWHVAAISSGVTRDGKSCHVASLETCRIRVPARSARCTWSMKRSSSTMKCADGKTAILNVGSRVTKCISGRRSPGAVSLFQAARRSCLPAGPRVVAGLPDNLSDCGLPP